MDEMADNIEPKDLSQFTPEEADALLQMLPRDEVAALIDIRRVKVYGSGSLHFVVQDEHLSQADVSIRRRNLSAISPHAILGGD